MSAPLLATKLYIPSRRPVTVLRPCLIERLNESLALGCKLTLISAPAGFGKTTLVSEWITNCGRPVAWLSLDEGDNDPARFIAYLVKALQTLALQSPQKGSKAEGIKADIGEGLLAALQSPQPLRIETILTTLLNEISTLPEPFLLILDDYHLVDSQPVDQALTFLIEHQPPQMHLVITTREDPSLPLPRLRARCQCTELRTADLRFSPAEAADFLNHVMGLNLSEENIFALEARTEGWIAGLQLAALSMQGHKDAAEFIQSFTGSHRFVMDYLLEEVLQQQPENIQVFLLRTSILERMCGSLCDAILRDPSIPGQGTLEYLEHANLFIIPLDNERRWYRYHHLFADLLRKRLGQSLTPEGIAKLQIHASEWFENNDLLLEAFRHAAAANDVERAERLTESAKMPLHLRGTATTILDWLDILPDTVRNARPALWWKQAALMLSIGQTIGVEEKLQAAEAALGTTNISDVEPDDTTRNLIGQIAAARASVALAQQQAETIFVQTHRALEYLHPNNLSGRADAIQTMGYAYYLQGDRAAASRAYAEALSIAQASGNIINIILAKTYLGQARQMENQLHLAAETYQSVLQLVDDYSPSSAGVVYFGLARICYEWNDLDAAEQYGERTLQLARQYDQFINRFILCAVFLARLKLVRGDVPGAEALLDQAEQSARQHNFVHRMPNVVAIQVLMFLCQGDLATAAELAGQYEVPISQARVFLSQGNPSNALAVLELYRQQVEAKDWQDERLRVIVLQAIALHVAGNKSKALELIDESLALAEPGGFIRLFVDEGATMAELLSLAAEQDIRPDYVNKLLAAFKVGTKDEQPTAPVSIYPSLIEPLSSRELEVLGLIAQGLSNQEICQRLFLALDTVKGHNRKIFEKLHVQRRTEAIARARELGLL